jgi:hypothetical protein
LLARIAVDNKPKMGPPVALLLFRFTSVMDIARYDHSALFFVTNWQVIDVGYVASRHSRAGLVRGRPCPNVVSQIVRLEQPDAATWIFWDYAWRLGALAVLGAIPSARTVAFRAKRLRMSRWEAALWVVGIVLVDHYLCGWIRRTVSTALPATVLGSYPEAHGLLHIVDTVFGLASPHAVQGHCGASNGAG